MYDSPKITDAGIEYLFDLKNLTFLEFTNTQVSDEVLEILQQHLPNLKRARTRQIKGTVSPTGGGFF